MGHDITAYRPNIDREELRRKFDLHRHDEGWRDRYRQYEAETEVAYNRRSAGNPLNQVLYLALGVMDEAYAGCSGNGEELDITLEQFETAQNVLDVKNFQGMARDRNFCDDLVQMFVAAGATYKEVPWECDVTQEKEFVRKCLEFLKANNLQKLTVRFG